MSNIRHIRKLERSIVRELENARGPIGREVISFVTKIPEDVLAVLLKRLTDKGVIKFHRHRNKKTGRFTRGGYILA